MNAAYVKHSTIPTATISTRPQADSVAISHNRVLLARTVWVITALLSSALFAISVPERWNRLHVISSGVRGALYELGISSDGFATYNVALEITFALVFTLIACVVFFRKSNDLAAIFFSLMLFLVGTASIPMLPTLYALELAQPHMMPLTRFMTFLTWAAVFVFFCVFPDGRFVPRWSIFFAAFTTLISVPWNLWPDTPLSPWTWPPYIFVPFEITVWGTCVYMQIYRYRHVSNPLQRQQTRWVVFGMVVSVTCVLAFFLPRMISPNLTLPTDRMSLLYYLVSSTAIMLSALFTPVVIGISILRYRLWAIDLILNRALVYIPLTGILTGLYAASITLFQKIFVTFTGDKSDGAVVISTLILASMFTPVKNALQSRVDKRFLQPPDPAQKLEEFGEHIESIVQVFDVQAIARRLLDEAIIGLEATGGGIYLQRQVAQWAARPHRHDGPVDASWEQQSQRGRWEHHSRRGSRAHRQPGPESRNYESRSQTEAHNHAEGTEQDRAWQQESESRKPYAPRGLYGDAELVYESVHWNGNMVIGVPLSLNGTRYGLLALGQRSNGMPYTYDDRLKLKKVADAVTDALVLERAPMR